MSHSHPPAAEAGDAEQFRAHAKAVLADVARNAGWRTRAAAGTGDNYDRERRRDFDRLLAEAGWAGIAIPKEFGGAGRGLAELAVVSEELAALGISTPFNRVALGIVAPALMLFGTDGQKKRYINPMLSCDEIWCQGFSEPDAGSDLAALRTSAEGTDRGWSISGTKVWTTLAHDADYCFLLARTSLEAVKHKGITAFLVPMDQPGVSVAPITQLNGEQDFAQVHFDGATTAADAVLGRIGEGWKVAMAALSYERSLHLLQRQLRLSRMLAELGTSVNWSQAEGGAKDRMLDAIIAIRSLECSVQTQLGVLNAGGQVGVEANASKVLWSETYQAVARLGLDLALAGLGPSVAAWSDEYYASLATSIYAGTNQVQRTIVAERALGLPR